MICFTMAIIATSYSLLKKDKAYLYVLCLQEYAGM